MAFSYGCPTIFHFLRAMIFFGNSKNIKAPDPRLWTKMGEELPLHLMHSDFYATKQFRIDLYGFSFMHVQLQYSESTSWTVVIPSFQHHFPWAPLWGVTSHKWHAVFFVGLLGNPNEEETARHLTNSNGKRHEGESWAYRLTGRVHQLIVVF